MNHNDREIMIKRLAAKGKTHPSDIDVYNEHQAFCLENESTLEYIRSEKQKLADDEVLAAQFKSNQEKQ